MKNKQTRRSAASAISEAISQGQIPRASTQHCTLAYRGDCSGRVEYHHPNYAYPLLVMPLCIRHHRQWHKHNEAENRHLKAPTTRRASRRPKDYKTDAEWHAALKKHGDLMRAAREAGDPRPDGVRVTRLLPELPPIKPRPPLPPETEAKPMVMPKPGTTESRSVRRACVSLGGVSATARRLDVGRESVHRWLRQGCGAARADTVVRLSNLTGEAVRLLIVDPRGGR